MLDDDFDRLELSVRVVKALRRNAQDEWAQRLGYPRNVRELWESFKARDQIFRDYGPYPGIGRKGAAEIRAELERIKPELYPIWMCGGH
jgi:hypothetical protein